MEARAAAEKIQEKFPGEVLGIAEFRGQISVTLRKGRVLEVCRYLHDDPEMAFDYLIDVCGADYLGKKDVRFEVVYHLYSIPHRVALRLKAEVDEADPVIDSVVPVWKGANWHEREAYDLYGISFKGHPDLRRILMPEDWEGHPLRKDYPVQGPGPDQEWPGFLDVLERSKRFKEFDWHD